MTETTSGQAGQGSKQPGGKFPKAGLKIRRIHTREGLHPYDEVTWERRDVVMTNWRDGSVNFEQRGVEFPDFWSVNAANIVTTKYFRGAVGSPQREWSLKQLVDRVVGTYTSAGREHGYFASEKDAQIFGLELTYALIHQIFSFNSPVWFNVGTSSPQQVSACQPYGALISTPGGLVPIGQLVEGNAVGAKVYDSHGITRVIATKANGVKDVLRVHTTAGYSLDVTSDHLVWRCSGQGTGAFVAAGELRTGDRLQWCRRPSFGESEIEKRQIAEAALAGWLQSDGFVGQCDGTNRSMTIEATTATDAEFGWVAAALDIVFPANHRHVTRVETQNDQLDRWLTRLYGTSVTGFADRWDLRARGADMAVPNRLFTAPLPVVAAYLRSVFQAEGFVSARRSSTVVEVDMISEQLIRGMQRLLLRFGIYSRVGFKADRRENRKGCWTLRIQPAGDRRIFADEIGFIDPVKADKLERSFGLPGLPAHETKSLGISRIEPLGPMDVYDIQTESGEYLCGNLRVHNCFILAVDDTMDSILEWYKEEGLIFKGGSGAGVNLSRIRSSKELLTSGGTASGPVSFMRGADASAGTIKSGGATRRAAKMVVLDVDHPDVPEFIETKAREEEKIRVLKNAGFDMDLGGKDIASVQYQNANNSVRVSAEFMRAVENGEKFDLLARRTGEMVDRVDAKTLFRKMAQAAWECADPGIQYDDTINDWHTCPESGRITASNPCSEYLSLDNSSCNLASINLLKFLRDDNTFDADRFERLTELVITAMDISICFADFPTEKITETTRAYRQLGIGYANLGALLMATGHAYDSEGGRAIAAAITSLMTGTAYRRSAELAAVVGPYDGYERNRAAHNRVMRKHAEASGKIGTLGGMDEDILAAASKVWGDCLKLGEANGYRNAQASLLAPTGCLTGDTLVTTDRGLTRLAEIGDAYGDRWQDLELMVSTDEGPRRATKFFVNGEEPTRRIRTEGAYQIQGTLTHRVKIVDPQTGAWAWKRLADITPGDVLPLQLDGGVGKLRRVPLPVLDETYYTGDRQVTVPDSVTPELAELVGYFMGGGSLHARGIRLCAADTDLDVVQRLEVLGKELFGIAPVVGSEQGYQTVTLQSVRLARWWQAAGFAKQLPAADQAGKGWVPRVPSAILEANDPAVYGGFLRGLFEADGTVLDGVPSVSSADESFAAEVRTLLLTAGLATTTRETVSGWGSPVYQVRLRNVDHALEFGERIGFIGERKASLLASPEPAQSANEPALSAEKDHVFLPAQVWTQLVPQGHWARDAVTQSLREHGGVPRMLARRIHEESLDPRLGDVLGYLFERVASNEDGGVRPTYDLSVPDNVTYVANGMVSHNTIGLMMDCDTTGIEPDLALVKFKKLVGGGSMQIVNQTVPRALRGLGYQPEQVEAITEYIAEHGHVVDAPSLRPEHYEVFDCAMGERAIAPMGHVRMIAAVQPMLSGSVSKTVNMPETATVEDVEEIYFQGWKLGLKALAIYRDNCKVGQPLSNAKTKTADAPPAGEQGVKPVRRRLPKSRPATVTRFSVAGAEGYMTASNYPDDGVGEVFLKLGKQGSTLAGVMDAFSIAISVGLQYGIPLESYVGKFTNMRFEPAGLTDDPDIRIATSVMDYIFRRLALDHLPYDQRAELGILSAAERSASLDATDQQSESLTEDLAQSAAIEKPPAGQSKPSAAAPQPRAGSSTELIESRQGRVADAPLCLTCGTKMRPAGSCYVCEGCGATSGCS